MNNSSDSTTYGISVLSIVAHPDDAEICAGGLLLKMKRLGYSTGIVDLTRGELGSRGSADLRSMEAGRAAAKLGLDHRENLGMPDGNVNNGTDEAAVRRVVGTIRKLRPELIVTHFWKERHPDHVAASALVTRATFLAGLPKFKDDAGINTAVTPRQVLYFPMRVETEPTFIVDISEEFKDKLEVIRCYDTQLAGAKGQTEFPKTLLSSDLTLPAMEARARAFGAKIGVAYGEPYITHSSLGIPDPLAHFRINQSVPSLYFSDFNVG